MLFLSLFFWIRQLLV